MIQYGSLLHYIWHLNYDNASITRIKNQIKRLDKYSYRSRHIYIYICIYRSFKTILRSIVIIHKPLKNSTLWYNIMDRYSPGRFSLGGKRIRHMVFYLSLDVPRDPRSIRLPRGNVASRNGAHLFGVCCIIRTGERKGGKERQTRPHRNSLSFFSFFPLAGKRVLEIYCQGPRCRFVRSFVRIFGSATSPKVQLETILPEISDGWNHSDQS